LRLNSAQRSLPPDGVRHVALVAAFWLMLAKPS
jgi:hypothetical protein